MVQPIKDYSATTSFNVGIAVDLGINAAIVYNELSFWSKFGKRADKFIFISYEDMMNRLPMLSKFQLSAAYKALQTDGWIEYKIMKANNAPTTHFRLLRNLTIENKETSLSIDSKETSLSITVDKHTVSNNTKKKVRVSSSDCLPKDIDFDETVIRTMQEFIDDRFERKKPMTERAVVLAFKDLHKWYAGNPSRQVECINRSIASGWLGLFELPQSFGSNNGGVFKA